MALVSIFLSIFCAGIVSLLLELSLLREFVYIFGSTAASNAFIISIFLLGLVAGSYLGTWRNLPLKTDNDARLAYAAVQMIGIVFIIVFFATKKYFIYDLTIRSLVQVYFLLMVLFPATLSGFAYALSVKIMHHRGERPTTYIYAVSTLGSVIGGLAHGIWLVPTWGMTSTYVCAVLFAATALVLILPRRNVGWLGVTVLVVAASLYVMIVQPSHKLFFKKNISFSQDSEFGIVELHDLSDENAMYHNAGIGGRIDEIDMNNQYVDFKINNVHQSYSFPVDYRIHTQWAELSLNIIGDSAKILLFGYGSGVTAAAYLRSSQTAKLDIVENCQPIVEAGRRIYPEEYARVYRDPRATMIIDDFRGHIRFTEERYDIVAIDHSLQDPYQCGYFTTDFFGLVKDKLSDRGIVILLGRGLSWNTTRLSFPYIYQNVGRKTEKHIREACLFLATRPLRAELDVDYVLIDQPPRDGGRVYADERVWVYRPY